MAGCFSFHPSRVGHAVQILWASRLLAELRLTCISVDAIRLLCISLFALSNLLVSQSMVLLKGWPITAGCAPLKLLRPLDVWDEHLQPKLACILRRL